MRKLYLLFLVFIHVTAYGQYGDMEAVRQFSENLQLWCSTSNIKYRPKIQDKCLDDCRVINDIMVDFARSNGLSIKDYVVPNYLNGFQKAMDKGTVVVNVSNVRIITSDQQSYTYGSVKKDQKLAKGYTTIACDIKVSGVLNYDIKDLFYLQKGKIVKITPYEEVIDRVTGKKKVKVDFSDLEDMSTLGFTLNYDQHFQAGASIIGQSGMFICSLDFGFNVDSERFYSDVMDMTDIMNYKRTETEYNPIMFATVSPGLFFKYFSVGCGIGVAILNSKETLSQGSYSEYEQGNSSFSYGSQSTSGYTVTKFMVRPQLRGFIPLGRSCKMSIGIGYDILPKAKELNGYNASLGFHFNFDNWNGLFNWW